MLTVFHAIIIRSLASLLQYPKTIDVVNLLNFFFSHNFYGQFFQLQLFEINKKFSVKKTTNYVRARRCNSEYSTDYVMTRKSRNNK